MPHSCRANEMDATFMSFAAATRTSRVAAGCDYREIAAEGTSAGEAALFRERRHRKIPERRVRSERNPGPEHVQAPLRRSRPLLAALPQLARQCGSGHGA